MVTRTRQSRTRISSHTSTGLIAKYRHNTGITEAGSGVSKWEDQSGNGYDFEQTTDANRPTLEADGSILFNGVDQWLETARYDIWLPATIYMVFNFQSKNTGGTSHLLNSKDTSRLAILYDDTTSQDSLSLAASTENGDATCDAPGLDEWTVVTVVGHGDTDSALIAVGNTTGDMGTLTATPFKWRGLTLGREYNNTNYSNIRIKELRVYDVQHAAGQRQRIVNSLMQLT